MNSNVKDIRIENSGVDKASKCTYLLTALSRVLLEKPTGF
jgi:hypothetical protein